MSTTVEATRPTTSQPARTERSGSSQFTRRKVVGYLVTLLTWVLVFLFFFPVLWMIITSFKTEGQAASFPPQFFFTPTLDRYAAVFDRGMAPVPAELVVRRGAVHRRRDAARHPGGVRLVGAADRPVAGRAVLLHLDQVHAGGRLDHPGLPAAALGQLLDNLWSLGLLYLGVNLPLAVWMMRSFFAEVPIAVVEAAQIDGASYSRELWRVSLPIVAPGAAAAALICFIFAWNEYFLANLLTAVVARTTPPFLGSFVDGRGQFLAILSAASTIAVLPVIVAGWLAQKRLVRGLAMGAVK